MKRRHFILGIFGCAAAPAAMALPAFDPRRDPVYRLNIKLCARKAQEAFERVNAIRMQAINELRERGAAEYDSWGAEESVIYIENGPQGLDLRAIHESLFSDPGAEHVRIVVLGKGGAVRG